MIEFSFLGELILYSHKNGEKQMQILTEPLYKM